jgi:hypothetical protein
MHAETASENNFIPVDPDPVADHRIDERVGLRQISPVMAIKSWCTAEKRRSSPTLGPADDGEKQAMSRRPTASDRI